MYIHIMNSTKPSFNLATEYYLFQYFEEDVIIIWQNHECVVLGCNQNAYKELNLDYIKQNKIEVVRRISGGGAVFHDLGNVNFTFITKNKTNTSLETFTTPVINILKLLGINAKHSGRNDIVINEQKISGNAQYIEGNKILHHGTLMYNVSHNKLTKCLNVNKDKIISKGLNSVRARVTNISSHLQASLSVDEFINVLYQGFIDTNLDIKTLKLNQTQINQIKVIEKNKFANENWIYGTKYNYSIANSKYLVGVGLIEIYIEIDVNLKILDFQILGDFFAKTNTKYFTEQFINKEFKYEIIKNIILSTNNFNNYFLNLKKEQLLEIIFQ